MYIYFGGDNLIILALFVLLSVFIVGFLGISFKILLALNNIRKYIKKRGER